MELISQHTKAIMEGCKERARAAGLSFSDESLEYIVTNRDLLELMPKHMIPTLYDYWVHDVEVLEEKGKYELYPHNPYETVINTRPPISFYNDNNPDWLNVMIFYHVLGHIDFFQNNLFFRHTWDYDFNGRALADKRLITRLRAEHGRWVDYAIEFARGIDNLVGYHRELSDLDRPATAGLSRRLDYYFDIFLQEVRQAPITEYVREVERYNDCTRRFGDGGEQAFLSEVLKRHPEFDSLFARFRDDGQRQATDLLQFLMDHSSFLNRSEHKWMKMVLEVVRDTAIFFQPQIRTKIMNEGWASYWHERLFLADDRIRGHEVEFARVHAGVTAMPRVGLNPYALGMRLFTYLEGQSGRGAVSYDFQRLADAAARDRFDQQTGTGQEFISQLRTNLCDFMFINSFVDQDFVDRHKLFVVGKRLNEQRQVWEYYVKSRKAGDYREMLLGQLYHPPHITVEPDLGEEDALYLLHHFEGKPLVRDFIPETLLGIEQLWGGAVQLETSEVVRADRKARRSGQENGGAGEIAWERVVYTMKDRTLSRRVL